MVIHDGVGQVEPFEVLHGRAVDIFGHWRPELDAKVGEFSLEKLDDELALVKREEFQRLVTAEP